jgi:hypothetical protein
MAEIEPARQSTIGSGQTRRAPQLIDFELQFLLFDTQPDAITLQ